MTRSVIHNKLDVLPVRVFSVPAELEAVQAFSVQHSVVNSILNCAKVGAIRDLLWVSEEDGHED